MKRVYISLILLLQISCSGMGHQSTSKTSLFDRLGGKPGIEAVVADFVNNCATDPRIKGFFIITASNKTRLEKFKGNLVDQICEAAGGPCKYTGKNMKEAHKKMKISNSHFDALVEDLIKSLNKLNVAKADQDQLLAVFGPMRADIVTK